MFACFGQISVIETRWGSPVIGKPNDVMYFVEREIKLFDGNICQNMVS